MSNAEQFMQETDDLSWRINTARLLKEIASNESMWILAKPLTILGHKLHDLAELAVKINDPRLHLWCMDMALYEQGNPEETPLDEIRDLRAQLIKQIEEMDDA